ncbi:PREDICTED: uncharacterized protein LOC105364739 [Ceratosolen solmsi marchali]|uniref:Uncharacterized protein LOC105364739 n=1 Tax=Ceratosolen solmsi marchali TaxID=326594 RepID=A0AAJ6YMZ6_9HYME|nr:PREDICTED: uncharacterized protein LOC105364739 [Ceratosolen solmsi marchali]
MAPTNKKKGVKGPPGRPKHEVWTLGFRRVLKHCEKTHRTIPAAFCVICNSVLCNTASKRLTAHRRICNIDQANHSELIEKNDSDPKIKEVTKILTTDNSATITFVDMDDTAQFVNEQSTSEDLAKTEYTFLDSTTETYDEFKLQTGTCNDYKLDTVLTKFFIGCNIPFSVADSSYFKKLCLALNPTCKIISSEQLSGSLLDNVYSKFHKDVKVSQTSVLLIDGWKNESTNTKNVTVMIRTETSETIFLDNYELSNNKDIVQELTDIAKMSIMEAYEQFKTEVYAIIMGNSWSLIKMDAVSEVWQFPCNSYVIKILTKEYISQDFMNTVCKILKQLNVIFKDDDLENKISSEMRWINTKCILEYCIANIGTIQTILSSENLIKLSKDYKCLFFDEEFIHKIESYINFLDSINELTIVCQTPKSNIADTAEQWLCLQLPDDDSETAEKLLARRDSVLKIQCLVANYLHPVYRGRKLSDNQMNKVEEFLLNELDSDGLNSLQSYVNGDSIFRVLNQKDGLSSQTYWSLARRTHNDLATLALKLLTIPASITSNFSQIFNTIKNTSLKPDKLRKLFAVYYHLKEKEEKLEVE